MPTYTFHIIGTDEYFDIMLKLSEHDAYKETHKDELEQVHLVPPGIVRQSGSIDSKLDGGMSETLQRIAEHHPDSPLGQRYGRKSIKQVKTTQAIEKHVGKYKHTDTMPLIT